MTAQEQPPNPKDGLYQPSPPLCLRWAVGVANASEAGLPSQLLATNTLFAAMQRRIDIGGRCISWATCDVPGCDAGGLLTIGGDCGGIGTRPLITGDTEEISLDDCTR